MAEVINLYAASGRNIIGDDSSPTLTLENVSSGAVLQLQNAGGTGPQLSMMSCPTTSLYITGAAGAIVAQVGGVTGVFKSTASASNVVQLSRTIVSSPTVGILRIQASGASTPAFTFAGQCVQSSASGTASLVAGIRAQWVNDDGVIKQGWIPLMENIA